MSTQFFSKNKVFFIGSFFGSLTTIPVYLNISSNRDFYKEEAKRYEYNYNRYEKFYREERDENSMYIGIICKADNILKPFGLTLKKLVNQSENTIKIIDHFDSKLKKENNISLKDVGEIIQNKFDSSILKKELNPKIITKLIDNLFESGIVTSFIHKFQINKNVETVVSTEVVYSEGLKTFNSFKDIFNSTLITSTPVDQNQQQNSKDNISVLKQYENKKFITNSALTVGILGSMYLIYFKFW